MDTAISGSHQETVRHKGSSKCSNHRQKDVVYVCQDCKILLCITCRIKSVHKTHNLEELSVVALEKKTAMLDFVYRSENYTLPDLQGDLIANDRQMTEISSEFQTISSSMKLQGEKCEQEIDELIAGFTAICEEIEKNNLVLLRHHKEDKQQRYDVELSEVEECKKALQTGTDVEIFDTDFDTLGSYTETNPPVLQTCQYTPCKTITDHLKQAIGIFTTCSTAHSQTFGNAKFISGTSDPFLESTGDRTEIDKACSNAWKSTGHPPSCKLRDELFVFSTFSFLNQALAMCTTPEGHLWILDVDRKTVLQINDEGKTKQKIELDNVTNDICVSPVTGRLWFCFLEDGAIYELQEPATPVPKFKTIDKTSCLCVTNSGVIVGTKSSLTIHTATGSVLHTITNKEQAVPFTLSNCSVTGNIAVVYGSENGESEKDSPFNLLLHIAVYDRTLNHQFTCKGEGIRGQKPVTPETFGPYSTVYDSFGNLIFADVKRNTIEVLSGTGQYLRTLDTRSQHQGAICIGSGNTLWSQGRDDEDNATIKLLKYCSVVNN